MNRPKFLILVASLLVGQSMHVQCEELDLTAISAEAAKAVVHVRTFKADGTPFMTGTGFFVSDTTTKTPIVTLITNLHVVRGAAKIEAISSDGTSLGSVT